MVDAINGIIGDKSRLLSSADYARLQRLQKKIRGIREPAWREGYAVASAEMVGLANAEPLFMQTLLTQAMPVVLVSDLPDARTLRAIALARPFEGRILRQWFADMDREDLRRITSSIQSGMIAGQGSRQIARNVVGTAAANGINGITQLARHNVQAVVRTAVQHTSNLARRQFLLENSDIVEAEQYVATLDGRTTAICRGLDGKIYEQGRGPQPPVHFNCRSLRAAYFDGVELGNRPMKPTTEKGLLREFTKANNLPNVSKRSMLPYGTKGAFDRFSRKRVRELVGPVPASTSYNDWLKTQPVQFQEDVLGVTKAKLYRNGDLALDKFVDRAGNELTLSELATKDAQAFLDAGLDPKDF